MNDLLDQQAARLAAVDGWGPGNAPGAVRSCTRRHHRLGYDTVVFLPDGTAVGRRFVMRNCGPPIPYVECEGTPRTS